MPRKRKKTPPLIGSELLKADFVVNNAVKIFHTPAVEKIVHKATLLLRAQKGAQAEALLRKALTLEPLKPDILYNLAQALEIQGLKEDSVHISKTTLILFPDYLFAHTALARAAMHNDDYENALDLLTPLFSRREFHISEYNALCSAVVELSLLTQQYHSARVWFDTWSQPDPKNLRLDVYRELLQKINA